jgi:hypothetical protein
LLVVRLITLDAIFYLMIHSFILTKPDMNLKYT